MPSAKKTSTTPWAGTGGACGGDFGTGSGWESERWIWASRRSPRLSTGSPASPRRRSETWSAPVCEELTTVSTVDPIKVYIPVGEQDYLKQAQNGKGGFSRPRGSDPRRRERSSAQGPFRFRRPAGGRPDWHDQGRGLFANPGIFCVPGSSPEVRAQSKVKQGAFWYRSGR